VNPTAAAAALVALEAEVIQTESVEVTELCEPTGDVMNPDTRALDVLAFVGCPQQV